MTILEKYGIQFYKKSNGRYDVKADNHNLGTFIYIYRDVDSVRQLLDDIDLALNHQFHLIEEPDWGRELGRDVYFGIINDDQTFDIYYEHSPEIVVTYPLGDMKEIFSTWLDFIKPRSLFGNMKKLLNRRRNKSR